MKVRASVKKICNKCKIVLRRQGKAKKGSQTKFVICEDKRHKQRQG